jgi:uncharacterized protein (TIGR03437 family)
MNVTLSCISFRGSAANYRDAQRTIRYHASDNTLVTRAKPAKAGEILTLFASGLGPTKPGVDLGEPFPRIPSRPSIHRFRCW